MGSRHTGLIVVQLDDIQTLPERPGSRREAVSSHRFISLTASRVALE